MLAAMTKALSLQLGVLKRAKARWRRPALAEQLGARGRRPG
jgi:hypothetical protein